MTVRQEVRPRTGSHGRRHQPLGDRVALRFPAFATQLTALFTKASLRLPRSWPLRHLLVEWATLRAFNALSRGDVELVRTITHAEAIWDLSRWEWPEDSMYYGRDGAVRFNEHWLGQFSELNFDVVSVEELDEDGVVFIHVRLRGVGRVSGVAVERDVFELVKIRDGLVWRGTMLQSRAEAIGASREP
jgi:ketosteroid isomerase-like protein